MAHGKGRSTFIGMNLNRPLAIHAEVAMRLAFGELRIPDRDRNLFNDSDAVSFESGNLSWVVG